MRIYIGFFVAIMLLVACSGLQRSSQAKTEDNKLFKIKKIKKLSSLHVIDARRNDSSFTILYPKVNNGLSDIRKGRTVAFNLKRIFPPKNFISYLEVHSYQVGNYGVRLNRRNHWSIYTDTTALQ